jgi:Tfp pilus assembly protein PilV
MPTHPILVQHPRAPSRRRWPVLGFTLVEVMLASFVLALAISTAITTLQRGFADLDSARNIETACRILQCELEKERLMTWAQVSVASLQPAIDSSFQSIPSVAGRFTLSRSIATVPNHSGNMLQITLTATWRTYDGRSQRRSLTTYYGNGGLYAYFTSQL